ncbi:MAG: hypothetical protein A2X67_07960 [Ignavibacteria bacterium GWA2_55_11]|nr:MAG: hypothetical protein A2X67_07960 [Ignavibacteria bacterium GWA2_55_11]OGU47614.1 MAG: hypothetical protein A2X68_02705 [Ignavibacteria bacterium GWC2_56_12]OGU66854.1 MAG: hypothetical protein A3C56_12595 [Ignavibacteria bacterium RIFCSPHIGHO2_02_FULL_56_12]OGU71188.1 MAG: hypothetical protein A3G43_05560 [Ignavibacteria bacterium RIFCSPLOWO2_12_FULL_56_21]OGU74767.1 MAG: hypothetical protein A3H45_10735 [Ignavibacteria bacterium RIFCSPLOWO2_02_FULL_55_14]
MNGELYSYFFGDHRRLEQLLDEAEKSDPINGTHYAEFRKGLLRHIGLEEKVLLPALLPRLPSGMQPVVDQIRRDHAAIGALMVPPPTRRIIGALRHILNKHNLLEETERGLYDACESLPANEVEAIVRKAREAPQVKVMPHNSSPNALDATARALQRAGYDAEALLGVRPRTMES